jgi:hypothetical protein
MTSPSLDSASFTRNWDTAGTRPRASVHCRQRLRERHHSVALGRRALSPGKQKPRRSKERTDAILGMPGSPRRLCPVWFCKVARYEINGARRVAVSRAS